MPSCTPVPIESTNARAGTAASGYPADMQDVKDLEWATQSSSIAWEVQGVWNCVADGASDVEVVSRSHSGDLLAAGDDFGRLHLYRHPACTGDVSGRTCFPPEPLLSPEAPGAG